MDKETRSLISQDGEDRIKVIKLYGEVIEDVTLADLKMQAGNPDAYDILVVEIASPGGSVSEGLDTMVWLDQLSSIGKQIVTVVTANSYSIASLIMLVADMRLISRHGQVMVHNPMVPLLEYVNANELQQYIDNLRALENTMYELYQFFTGLEKVQIKELMDKESYLDPQQAVDMGFADVVIDIKPKSYEMTTNTKNEINMSKTLNILNKVIGMVNKSEFINQIYSDLEGGEIEIYQADPATYQVGDKTSMEEGEVVLSDGSKLTIVEGKIAEINRDADNDMAVEEEAAVDGDFNEGAAPEEMMDEPKMEEVEEMMDEPKMDEHEGEEMPEVEAPVEAPVEEPVEAPKKKDDMPSKVIETTEQIITTKETVAVEVEATEAVAEEVEMKEEMMDEEKMMDEPKMEQEEMMDEPKMEEESLDRDDYVSMDEYKAMEERMVAMEEKMKEYEMRFENLSKFENVATEAIDTLAANTVSSFKPEAKASSKPSAPKGSIFNQLKAKRGL